MGRHLHGVLGRLTTEARPTCLMNEGEEWRGTSANLEAGVQLVGCPLFGRKSYANFRLRCGSVPRLRNMAPFRTATFTPLPSA